MNLPFNIAKRYLFAKKSTNAINIITGISVFGISIGTAALILVLSVFNGFEELLVGLFDYFNPDVKVEPVKGKTFEVDTLQLDQIIKIDGVVSVSKTLEETAIFEYAGSQDFGTIKGVDINYAAVSGIDKTIREGEYKLKEGNRSLAVLGSGIQQKLSISISDYLSVLDVYMAKRKKVSAFEQPFKKVPIYPAGVFNIQQDFDSKYVIASLEFVQNLVERPNAVSALEIKLAADSDPYQVVKEIQKIVGPSFKVRDRFQQDEAFLKIMNIEKWIGFAVVGLTLILVAFNIIGALWMIVLEKKKDIAVLKSMGAEGKMIRKIFINEGLLIAIIGLISGVVLALLLYILQKQFGLISLQGAFVVDAYPISIKVLDFIVVAITVLLIGWLASLIPAQRASLVSPLLREE